MFERLNQIVMDIVSGRSRRFVTIICVLLVALLCWVDYLTGDYSLIIFYLIPVSIVAWFVSRNMGLFFCLLSFVARFCADYVSSPSSRYSTLHIWNLISELVFLVIMSLLCSTLKQGFYKETRRS